MAGPHRATKATASEAAYRALKRDILTCRIEPGQDLREAALAEQAGFGRTPIREALARLVHDGLVEVRPRQGYQVTEITLTRVRELHELRLLLEPAAAELAIARATDAELEALHDLAHATYVHAEPDTYERFIQSHREFHVSLAGLGNRLLAEMLDRILEELHRAMFRSLRHRDLADQQVDEHKTLLDAVEARDVRSARRICIEQIDHSHELIISTMLSHDLRSSLASFGQPLSRTVLPDHFSADSGAAPPDRR